MTKKKSIILISLATLIMIAILIGVSYAYWKKSKVQTGVNVIELGCLDISIKDEENDITLRKAIPISDEDGMSLTPYTFTVKNTCSTAASYDINLEVLSTTTLNLSYVDALLDNGSIKLISSLNDRDATITGATSKNLGTGTLNGGQEKSYSLRLWLDKGVTLSADSQQKKFEAKIAVVATATETSKPICKRATTLHTELCNESSSGCSATGSIGKGNTITYGNATTTEGVLNTGDAFDCDVDGTGYNHRFYYVSDLYTGGGSGSETWDEDTAVLIYYSNTIIEGTTITPNNTIGVAYNSNDKNYEGPVSLIEHLPGNNIWTKLSINESRQIRSEIGTTSVTYSGTTYPISFSGYINKAARLLTTQELNRGCELTTFTMYRSGSLDTNRCRFLLESTKYANNANLNGYWFETPIASVNDDGLGVSGIGYSMTSYSALNSGVGVRPAIEVPKSEIEY